MFLHKSSSWTFVLVSTLFLSIGACGGTGTDAPDGDAGAGGSAGSPHPGTGGTVPNPGGGGSGGEDPGPGGTGGDEPGPGGTGGKGGTGGRGGTGGGRAPREFDECTQIDEVVSLPNGSTLVCVEGLYVVPAWLVACETSADCPNPITFCGATVLDLRFCLSNVCGGGDSFFVSGENGDFFEACNPEHGVSIAYDDRGQVVYEAQADELTGTCLPLFKSANGRAEGYCHASGYVPPGERCDSKLGGRRSYGTLCEQGSVCSTRDICIPVCDARGRSSAPFSTCSSPSASCEHATDAPPTDHAVGFCVWDEVSACEDMCDQVYDCGWRFGNSTLQDCYNLCDFGAFLPEEVSCIGRIQGCGSAAYEQAIACLGGGTTACVDENDFSVRCEACLDDALDTCTSPGGVCAGAFDDFFDCAVAQGCTTPQCGMTECPAEWGRYAGCITDRCDDYRACFP